MKDSASIFDSRILKFEINLKIFDSTRIHHHIIKSRLSEKISSGSLWTLTNLRENELKALISLQYFHSEIKTKRSARNTSAGGKNKAIKLLITVGVGCVNFNTNISRSLHNFEHNSNEQLNPRQWKLMRRGKELGSRKKVDSGDGE